MVQKKGSESEFGALFEAHLQRLRTDFAVGDKIQGTITAIDRNSIFVDVGGRCDAILERTELADAEGNCTVQVGDRIEAFCVGQADDTVRLTTRMAGSVAEASLFEAYEAGIPVEGRVLAERKGGYDVQVAGQRGFCPYSQMDLFRREPQAYIGEKFTFLIGEYSDDGSNLILSRRRYLEQEQARKRQELRQTLAVGDLLEGTVTRIMPFGAFVDMGSGVEGLIHVSELGWGRNLKAEDVLSVGQAVTVSVTALDWDNDRVGLSLRHAQADPWETLATDGRYAPGRRCEGTVTKVMPFGAFVELEPGIEGLVHVTRLGAGRRVKHPSEVLSEGDRVEVSILDLDSERRRLALSMDDTLGDLEEREGEAGEPGDGAVRPGARLKGRVEGHRDFGVFVKLPGGLTGLLHISQVEIKGSSNPGRALFRMFPPDSEVDVVVRGLDGKRISLTLPATLEREAAEQELHDFQDGGGGKLGSMSGLFDGLNLPRNDPSR
ncbi:MAG: S1 RNA-binding domain-containing protein [Lentisphaeria bacterium]|nr:S1 RNA-binding domain-containing protein [Lentisphaeria bacterium]